MNHLSQEDLVLHHYREETRPEVASHLLSCPSCREEYEVLKKVLETISAAEVPERGVSYSDEVWRQLRWKLAAPPKSRLREWGFAGAVAAMLFVAFVGGRLWQKLNVAPTETAGPSTIRVASTEEGREQVLVVVVGDHFERTERVLLELANSAEERNGDISMEQNLAEDLVFANRIYRQSAMLAGDTRLASLLDEIESILLEISHTDDGASARQIDSIRKRIDERGLVFKLRVAGEELKQRGKEKTPNEGEISL